MLPQSSAGSPEVAPQWLAASSHGLSAACVMESGRLYALHNHHPTLETAHPKLSQMARLHRYQQALQIDEGVWLLH